VLAVELAIWTIVIVALPFAAVMIWPGKAKRSVYRVSRVSTPARRPPIETPDTVGSFDERAWLAMNRYGQGQPSGAIPQGSGEIGAANPAHEKSDPVALDGREKDSASNSLGSDAAASSSGGSPAPVSRPELSLDQKALLPFPRIGWRVTFKLWA
jgi:hypothetical protein